MFTLVYTVLAEIDKIITLFNEDYTVRQKVHTSLIKYCIYTNLIYNGAF